MVIWKNESFASKGVIVEKTPVIVKAKKKIETYQIDGRNGFLSVDSNSYEPFPLTLECHCKESVSLDDVKEWLDGFGTLSLDGEREYTAIINNSIDFTKVLAFKRFIVQFLVNPIAQDITETTETITTSPKTLTINGATYKMFPMLEIKGTGNVTITFNSKSFSLANLASGTTYYLDCANQVATDGVNNIMNKMNGDFPCLEKGNNSISFTGSITEIKIRYRKAYL